MNRLRLAIRSQIFAISLGVFLSSPVAAAQVDCTSEYDEIESCPMAFAAGIASYRVYKGETFFGEIVDTIDLLDDNDKYIGVIMGGLFRSGTLEGYQFSWTDIVGIPPLLTAVSGNDVYYYSGDRLLARGTRDEVGTGFVITENYGLMRVRTPFRMLGAVMNDPEILSMLADSPASVFPNSTEIDPSSSNDDEEFEDCPGWVVTTACTTCAACVWVGQAPPPCWGACATCAYCYAVAIPPSPDPPTPRPKPYPCTTFMAQTLVHTPSGLAEIQSLPVGSQIYTLDQEGHKVVGVVATRNIYSADLGAAIFCGAEALYATRGHRLMGSSGWIPAEKIGAGTVRSIDGTAMDVITLSACEAGLDPNDLVPVCHITVDGGEGYFVGAAGLYAEEF